MNKVLFIMMLVVVLGCRENQELGSWDLLQVSNVQLDEAIDAEEGEIDRWLYWLRKHAEETGQSQYQVAYEDALTIVDSWNRTNDLFRAVYDSWLEETGVDDRWFLSRQPAKTVTIPDSLKEEMQKAIEALRGQIVAEAIDQTLWDNQKPMAFWVSELLALRNELRKQLIHYLQQQVISSRAQMARYERKYSLDYRGEGDSLMAVLNTLVYLDVDDMQTTVMPGNYSFDMPEGIAKAEGRWAVPKGAKVLPLKLYVTFENQRLDTVFVKRVDVAIPRE